MLPKPPEINELKTAKLKKALQKDIDAFNEKYKSDNDYYLAGREQTKHFRHLDRLYMHDVEVAENGKKYLKVHATATTGDVSMWLMVDVICTVFEDHKIGDHKIISPCLPKSRRRVTLKNLHDYFGKRKRKYTHDHDDYHDDYHDEWDITVVFEIGKECKK